MRVWRICRAAHRELDGEGARLYGGRWNPEGIPVLYTSSTLALAALEALVHMDIAEVPDDLVAMAIEVPDDAGQGSVAADDLPDGWDGYPAPAGCAEIGARWIAEGSALALRVPSAAVPEEFNVLINPAHPRAAELRVRSTRPFAFDTRLLR